MGAFVIAFAIVTRQQWKHFPRHGMRRRRESSDLYLGDGSQRIRPTLLFH